MLNKYQIKTIGLIGLATCIISATQSKWYKDLQDKFSTPIVLPEKKLDGDLEELIIIDLCPEHKIPGYIPASKYQKMIQPKKEEPQKKEDEKVRKINYEELPYFC
jgi:hypothetical protein